MTRDAAVAALVEKWRELVSHYTIAREADEDGPYYSDGRAITYKVCAQELADTLSALTTLDDGGSLNGPSRLGASPVKDTGGEIVQPITALGGKHTPECELSRGHTVVYPEPVALPTIPQAVAMEQGRLAKGDPTASVQRTSSRPASCTCGALGGRPETGWHPIDTAPQDGSWMLAWHYDVGIHIWRTGPGLIQGEDFPEPTHWQPLPSPPLQEQP